jgi:hypothetical protein
MYCVRRWNNDRDEMTEEFVDVLVLDRIAMDGYVSVTWDPSVWCVQDEMIPVLEAGPGGVRIFTLQTSRRSPNRPQYQCLEQ